MPRQLPLRRPERLGIAHCAAVRLISAILPCARRAARSARTHWRVVCRATNVCRCASPAIGQRVEHVCCCCRQGAAASGPPAHTTGSAHTTSPPALQAPAGAARRRMPTPLPLLTLRAARPAPRRHTPVAPNQPATARQRPHSFPRVRSALGLSCRRARAHAASSSPPTQRKLISSPAWSCDTFSHPAHP